jgi:hypothetical protein
MSTIVPDSRESGPSRARVPGRNGGTLTPFRNGEGQVPGFRKPHRLTETLQLARKASPAAMAVLIERLSDPDGRVAVTAANLILERAWGKVKEYRPEERQEGHIDLSQLTNSELALLVRLCDSGRLQALPAEDQAIELPINQAASKSSE